MTQPPEQPNRDEPYAQQPPPPPYPGGAMVPPPYQPPAAPGYGYGYGPYAPQPQGSDGLYVAAAVLNWVILGLLTLGTCGLGIVAAAWFVPMTIFIHKGAKDRYKHTALGVCTLLFCGVIPGILMLVADSSRQERPVA